jgi:phage tail P2-like protein
MTDITFPLPPALATDPRFKVLAQIALEAFDIDLSPLLVYLIDTVDVSVLPYLAEQFSLIGDGWELATNEAAQRSMLKSAIEIHRYKGTPWAIKQVFISLGLGEVDIDEGRSGYRRDGAMKRDGFAVRGERSARWAEYRIRCHRLLSVQQAALARKLLASMAPARCLLVGIDFSDAALIRNGFARRDGTYTRGVA